jgi:hypothetical protein
VPIALTVTMSFGLIKSSLRVLDPFDRFSEILCGLIMVLTFTGSLSVANAGQIEIRTMLVGSVGCNLAWSIVDAVLYLLGSLARKVTDLKTIRAVRQAADPEAAQRLITAALPPVFATILQPADFADLRFRLRQLPEPPQRAQLDHDDWLGAFGVLAIVFLATFPVVAPFLFIHNSGTALRVSHAVAISLLFLTGYAFGHSAGRSSWLMGVALLILGAILTGLTIALGG